MNRANAKAGVLKLGTTSWTSRPVAKGALIGPQTPLSSWTTSASPSTRSPSSSCPRRQHSYRVPPPLLQLQAWPGQSVGMVWLIPPTAPAPRLAPLAVELVQGLVPEQVQVQVCTLHHQVQRSPLAPLPPASRPRSGAWGPTPPQETTGHHQVQRSPLATPPAASRPSSEHLLTTAVPAEALLHQRGARARR